MVYPDCDGENDPTGDGDIDNGGGDSGSDGLNYSDNCICACIHT